MTALHNDDANGLAGLQNALAGRSSKLDAGGRSTTGARWSPSTG